jgi:multimeric flavodoxin WrbA
MKFLFLTSSFRKKGNTALLVSLLEQSMQTVAAEIKESIETETVNLAYCNIQLCHGCRICFDKGETCCPYWGDISEIKAAMQNADGLVLASPVYVEDINGVMKTYLERLAHLNHRPEFGGKYAYLLTTSGAGSSGHSIRTMGSTLRAWGYHIIGQQDFVSGALMSQDEMTTRYQLRIDRIARRIIGDIKKKKAQKPSFFSLVFFKVQQRLWQRRVEDSVDYHYWESKGWIKPKMTYYFPHKANWLAVASARLAGSIIAKFFA